MNKDLYDTGSAVVGLYRLFTNFFKNSLENPQDWVDPWGGGGCPWVHRTFPLLSFIFHTFSIKTIRDYQRGTLPETGKKTI